MNNEDMNNEDMNNEDIKHFMYLCSTHKFFYLLNEIREKIYEKTYFVPYCNLNINNNLTIALQINNIS